MATLIHGIIALFSRFFVARTTLASDAVLHISVQHFLKINDFI